MGSGNADYNRRAAILSALASPARLHIVDSLSRGEKTVGELSEEVGLSLSTVSRHLGLLHDAGLVLERRQGTRVFQLLAAPCVLDFFECVEKVIAGGGCSIPGRKTPE